MIRIECSLRLLLPVGSLLLLVGLGPDRLEHLEGDDRGERTDGGDAEVHQVMSPVASSAERWKAKKNLLCHHPFTLTRIRAGSGETRRMPWGWAWSSWLS